MSRFEQAYQGRVIFHHINIDNPGPRDWQLLSQFYDNSVPSYGFFDGSGALVDSMAGWNEWEFERRLRALAGAD